VTTATRSSVLTANFLSAKARAKPNNPPKQIMTEAAIKISIQSIIVNPPFPDYDFEKDGMND
jgi:hypothetical protein